jgi:sec-independent protein translocase protein TatA
MGIGMRELLIILLIALVVFGAKRLRTIGSDLGGALRGFKDAMAAGDEVEEQLRVKDDRVRAASTNVEREKQTT